MHCHRVGAAGHHRAVVDHLQVEGVWASGVYAVAGLGGHLEAAARIGAIAQGSGADGEGHFLAALVVSHAVEGDSTAPGVGVGSSGQVVVHTLHQGLVSGNRSVKH